VPVFPEAGSDACPGAVRQSVPGFCGPVVGQILAGQRRLESGCRERPARGRGRWTRVLSLHFRRSETSNLIWVQTPGPAVSWVQLWHGRMTDGIPGVCAGCCGPSGGQWLGLRASSMCLFGRPPDFAPFRDGTVFRDGTFCEWIFRPGHWEIHVVEKDHPLPRQAPVRFGVEDIHAARQTVLSLGSRLTRSKSCQAWCDGATSPIRGATGVVSTRICPAGSRDADRPAPSDQHAGRQGLAAVPRRPAALARPG
jgi:hypothetical protein